MTFMNKIAGQSDMSQVEKSLETSGAQAKQEEVAVKDATIAATQNGPLQDPTLQEEESSMAGQLKSLDKKIEVAKKATEKEKVDKGKGEKKLIPVDNIDTELQEFKRRPQFQSQAMQAKLNNLIDKLKQGLTDKEMLTFVKSQFSDPDEQNMVLRFIASISKEEDKEAVNSLVANVEDEINKTRIKEENDKSATEAKKATETANLAALQKIITISKEEQSSDEMLKQLFDNLLINFTLEAPAIFNLLDSAFKQEKQLKGIETFILKKCANEINDLKQLDDGENISRMKVVMRLLKITQALIGVDRYFDSRNKGKKG